MRDERSYKNTEDANRVGLGLFCFVFRFVFLEGGVVTFTKNQRAPLLPVVFGSEADLAYHVYARNKQWRILTSA